MVGKYVQIRELLPVHCHEALMQARGVEESASRVQHSLHRIPRNIGGSMARPLSRVWIASLVPWLVSGERGIEGKIQAVRYAREQGADFVSPGSLTSACRSPLSSTVATCWARPDRKTARSLNRATPYPVIADDLGVAGSRRVACRCDTKESAKARPCALRVPAGSLLSRAGTARGYMAPTDIIMERHRHRYEFNNNYLDRFRQAGLVLGLLTGQPGEGLELTNHPWFVAHAVYHPEFTSTPAGRPSPVHRFSARRVRTWAAQLSPSGRCTETRRI